MLATDHPPDLDWPTPSFLCMVLEIGVTAHGTPESVVRTVLIVTKLKGKQAPEGHDGTLAAGDPALKVKHADVTDDLDEDRLALLDPAATATLRRKYANALERLGLA